MSDTQHEEIARSNGSTLLRALVRPSTSCSGVAAAPWLMFLEAYSDLDSEARGRRGMCGSLRNPELARPHPDCSGADWRSVCLLMLQVVVLMVLVNI